eukprot:gnl/TRDRNA2_/TRDRNA2_91758_c0_seq1.p1 gnl/TRDRNA2_/TRDRNA2_91758_c0~~gnl/TRDRNA2_/TRDRNA2_91758_c0_seq1.p1  ORF type:complete len:300 (-),score=79.11 gnl/TRDRNA2_/TRDRNA2_91758_c0_seq1:65-964(-)
MSNFESGCLPCTNCFVTVPQDKWYAVEKFGKYDKIIGPGLSFTGIDICGTCIGYRSISSRVDEMPVMVQTKTKDNVFVNVRVAVQHSVIADNVHAALYKLSNVASQIDSYVSDVIRSQLPKMNLDDAFEKKDEISDAVQEQLKKGMADYGFQIHRALVTELMPNQQVMDSMNEINKQKRLRDASQMAAEAEKIRVVKAAEASAEAAFFQGQGIARQRGAIIDGLRNSISGGNESDQIGQEKVSELLLMTQYFETLRDIATTSRQQTVFVPNSAGSVKDIAAQIRGGILTGGAAPAQVRM